MDAIELGRQTAESIHDRLAREGVDPWDSMAIVNAEASRRKIEITAVKAGSPLLAQARASYDPVGSSIQHEQTGDAFLNAFLIAHELGHATLGDDRVRDEVAEVDPGRAAEAAPVGEERVVDYSRRSRREVQMDLFARELLLPRSFVRRFHLEEGMSASAIADRLGAPYDAVAQQLLDALLLPPVELEADHAEERPLNERQRVAAAHRGGPFLLEAGPGTGKTKTLVERLNGLIDDGVDPRTIVVLTYSNKAAGELAERISRKRPQAAAAMWIGTFHAFGLNLIRRFHRELGYQREPGLLDRSQAIEMMIDEVAGLDLDHYRRFVDPTDTLRDLLSAVSRAQDEVVLSAHYAQLAEAMETTAAPDDADLRKCKEIARVYARYDEVKKAAGRVDFGDLVAMPVDFLARRDDIAAKVRAETQHVLVDEYQDVNRASVRLLQLLTEGGANLWCVGDIRQSIYRFRGASSYNVQLFDVQDFPGGKRDRLEVNYRSTQEIVDAYSAFAADMPVSGATSAALLAERGISGHPVEFGHVHGENQREIDAIADAVKEMLDSGHAFRDQALLCSGNERLAKLGAGLEARGIPILYLGSLFDRPEVKDLLSWLSLLIDRRAMALARGTDTAGLGFGLGDVAAISEMLGERQTEPLAWITSPPASLSPDGATMVARYAALFDGLEASDRPWEIVCRMLLDRTRIAAGIAEAADVAGRAKGIAIWQFMNFLRVQPVSGSGTIGRTLDRIRRLVLLSDDRDLRSIPEAAKGIDAVRLMTMHGSKGLEFPVVHIPGMNLGTLPRAPRAPACPPPDGMIAGTRERGRAITDREHAEEQECLFYVALSRAKDRLILYAPDRTAGSEKRGPSRRQPSPFIARLGTGLRRTQPRPNVYAVEAEQSSVALKFNGTAAFSQAELALFERCPRRFFYTHILKLGGRRTTSAYEDMHDIVRKVAAALVADFGPAADPAALADLVDRHWRQSPLASRPVGSMYRPLADELVANFVRSVPAGGIAAGTDLTFTLADAVISVKTDYVAKTGAGILRQVRTGHSSSTEMEGAVIACLQIAAQSSAPGSRSEITFLGDDANEPIAFGRGPLETRVAKLAGHIANISAGQFEPDASTRTCPKCPAFFACGPVPPGALEKTFR